MKRWINHYQNDRSFSSPRTKLFTFSTRYVYDWLQILIVKPSIISMHKTLLPHRSLSNILGHEIKITENLTKIPT